VGRLIKEDISAFLAYSDLSYDIRSIHI